MWFSGVTKFESRKQQIVVMLDKSVEWLKSWDIQGENINVK